MAHRRNFSAPQDFIRNNVAILALFECIDKHGVSGYCVSDLSVCLLTMCACVCAVCVQEATGSRFVVANTHLFWNPDKTQVKLVQAQYLLEQLRAALTVWREDAVLLAGDFNSLPPSGVFEYITTGRLGPAHSDRRYFPSFASQHE